ncbi:hypothetical protein BU17DRAFT_65894 [Hysterangium stoloniferum]|nr:hypothetical protein BU17DRAFT_65894 [Hysterangium stoloniferum]
MSHIPFHMLKEFEDPVYMKNIKQKGVTQELDDVCLRQMARRSRVNVDNLELGKKSPVGDRRRQKHTLPMSMMISVPKHIHKSGFLRTKLKARLKEALNLVAIRGAHVNSGNIISFATPAGVLDPESSPLLQGWAYIIRPTLELHRAPWPAVITELQSALKKIKSKAIVAQGQWKSEKPRCHKSAATGKTQARPPSSSSKPHYPPNQKLSNKNLVRTPSKGGQMPKEPSHPHSSGAASRPLPASFSSHKLNRQVNQSQDTQSWNQCLTDILSITNASATA